MTGADWTFLALPGSTHFKSAALAEGVLAYTTRSGLQLALVGAQRLLEGMSDEEYQRRDAATGRGRVGAHLRHVLDHYGSLLDGCALGIVDYDQRRREEALETSRAAAKARIAHVLSELRALEHLAATTPLVVLLDCGRGGARSSTNSTLGRELQFLASHTVHHYAVVGLILAARGHEVHAEFGDAPSTLKHEAEQAACAR